jgi:hypothetical protein
MGNGPVRIIASTAEQMFLDLKPAEVAGFTRYSGDLELIKHSAGSLTFEGLPKELWFSSIVRNSSRITKLTVSGAGK